MYRSKKIFSNVPLPVAGLGLGFCALGNLIGSYSMTLRYAAGAAGGLILLIVAVKIIMDFSGFRDSMGNYVTASVFPTFSMGLMVFSTYLVTYSPEVGLFLWAFGLSLHVILILHFTLNFLFRMGIKNVLPTYFVVYVGIVAASVTAPFHGTEAVGRIVFWFGLICYLVLLPVCLYRFLAIKQIPEPNLPTTAIFMAPANICLAGYMLSFPVKTMWVVYLLTILSLTLTVFVVVQLPRLMRLRFYPSFSAFTFPIVIGATAAKLTVAFAAAERPVFGVLNTAIYVYAVFAALAVLFVFYKYIAFLSGKTH